VAGVAGELYTQSYVSDADTNIQAFNTGVLKEAQDRASVARLEAGIADLKAACANERAAVAEAKTRAAMLLQLDGGVSQNNKWMPLWLTSGAM
jgi:hypothetical protein